MATSENGFAGRWNKARWKDEEAPGSLRQLVPLCATFTIDEDAKGGFSIEWSDGEETYAVEPHLQHDPAEGTLAVHRPEVWDVRRNHCKVRLLQATATLSPDRVLTLTLTLPKEDCEVPSSEGNVGTIIAEAHPGTSGSDERTAP